MNDELDIIDDLDEGLSVSRSNFIGSVMYSLKEYFNSEKVFVEEIKDNYVILRLDDETESFNLDDDLDLEIKVLVYSLASDRSLMVPSLRFRIVEDATESLMIVGIDLLDGNTVVIPDRDNEDYDYTIEVSSRYLVNRLQMLGVISFSRTHSQYLKLVDNPKSSTYSHQDSWSGWLDEEFSFKNESSILKNPTKGSVIKNKKLKKLKRKRIKMMRVKDPSGYRKRSRAAKLRWRKYRNKYKKSFKKLYRSTKGKRMAKMRGKALSIGSNL